MRYRAKLSRAVADPGKVSEPESAGGPKRQARWCQRGCQPVL